MNKKSSSANTTGNKLSHESYQFVLRTLGWPVFRYSIILFLLSEIQNGINYWSNYQQNLKKTCLSLTHRQQIMYVYNLRYCRLCISEIWKRETIQAKTSTFAQQVDLIEARYVSGKAAVKYVFQSETGIKSGGSDSHVASLHYDRASLERNLSKDFWFSNVSHATEGDEENDH